MKKLRFNKKFEAIVCLDGIMPNAELFTGFKDMQILAADGAANRLMDMGIDFDKVIGDLDSIERDNATNKISDSKKIFLPDQETNDFDKTLKYANGLGLENILILGFHGGELEHTLNNWSVLMRYAENLNLCIYENGRYAIPVRESITFDAETGELIGLIPQSKAVLTTKGLKWQLNNEALELGIREGARNIAVAKEIQIEVHSGSILVFVNSRIPFAPIIE